MCRNLGTGVAARRSHSAKVPANAHWPQDLGVRGREPGWAHQPVGADLRWQRRRINQRNLMCVKKAPKRICQPQKTASYTQATVYMTNWPLTASPALLLYLDPRLSVPFDSLPEALAATEFQVCPCQRPRACSDLPRACCCVHKMLRYSPHAAAHRCRCSGAWQAHGQRCTG